ncbi:aspartate:alanine exchanger family transporter [Corynebacterium endometrii]|uniref:Aspartate/alanine antiporter n=1 Tax=Corynebacterium endometrii TaxID=2488819 RepID=A0A4P7QFM5_9CORY|nr:Aspartate/alanine antiporter [Corynebacterium endometrii]
MNAITPALDLLASDQLLALFFIMAVGLALGKVRFLGVSLGAAAAMFVALGLSTANPEIQIPALVYQFGLALFVYAIGLSFGRTFFREFRTRGWKLTVLMLFMLILLVGVGAVLIKAFDLDPAIGTGMFAGSLSSTPGMAAVVEILGTSDPVVGYSLAYPGGVLGAIIVGAVGAAVLKINHHKDAEEEGLIPAPLVWKVVRMTKDHPATASTIAQYTGQKIMATRVVTNHHHHELAPPNLPLNRGVELLVNGTEESLDAAIDRLGEEVDMELADADGLMYTRVTVSAPDVAGHAVRELDTLEHGFLIARVRSGDADAVPNRDTVLNYSDRVRVVTSPENMPRVKKFLGDSEKALGDADLLSMSLGLTLGILLGLIPIPLPGGQSLSLGFGGGPIVVGLILGYLNRTGPIHWQLPFHTRQAISNLGLTLFLAGVGTSAGGSFREALTDPASFKYMAAGFAVTLFSAVGITCLGMMVLKLKWDESIGVAAGMTTNPAVISYLNTQTGTELANRGYATVYPTTIIGKIVACQVLLLFL